MALEVAEELGLPVMAHIDHPPPSRKEVLERPAPGRRAHTLLPAVSEFAAAR
jgi:predicted amidohydrolase